ncbi:MAG: hypothetical protein J6P47_07095, partial [Acetobacter sp.]|nr:hypothetical protein [Acetobacter sp.]
MFIYQFLQVPSVLVSLSLVTSFLIKKSFIGKERVNSRVFYPDLFTMHAVYDAVRVRGIKYKTGILYSGFLLPHLHVCLFSLHRSKKYFVVSFFAREFALDLFFWQVLLVLLLASSSSAWAEETSSTDIIAMRHEMLEMRHEMQAMRHEMLESRHEMLGEIRRLKAQI